MEENGKDILKQLSELIALFEKLRDKAIREGVVLKDDPMYKNFEMLAGNYELIKNNIPPGLIEEMGEPIKNMIAEMVVQLKKELGVETSTNEPSNSLINELDAIDKLLENKNISEEEINKLLDKRTQYKKD